MRRYLQYEPFNIYSFEAKEWEHPVHKHNHCEIIFIREGKGKHVINSSTFSYTSGDVFLLGQEDSHYFEIDRPTVFCFIRFMEVFFNEESLKKTSNWQQTIEFLLNAPYQSYGSIMKQEDEKEILTHLLTLLLHEYNHRHDSFYEVIMNGVMKAILSVLARNIIKHSSADKKSTKQSKAVGELIIYIQKKHINPESLRVDYLAEKFHFSPNYLSIFFKKHTGESLQQYILKYKLKLIENRLQYSNLNISQISYEFGFTDESHLNKTFRKYYGIPPGAFRSKVVGEQFLPEAKG